MQPTFALREHLHGENEPRDVGDDEDGADGDEDDGVVGLAVVVAAVDVGAGSDDGSEKDQKMRKCPPGTCSANVSNVKFDNTTLH